MAALSFTWLGHSTVLLEIDGTRVLTASNDKTARVWDLSGKELATLQGHTAGVTSAVFSPDGQRVATAGDASITAPSVISSSTRSGAMPRRWHHGLPGCDRATMPPGSWPRAAATLARSELRAPTAARPG